MNKSKIEWCSMTWNPVTGCRHGCEYCYARRIAERFGGYDLNGKVTTGCPLPTAELTEPLTITRKNGKEMASPFPFGFEPTLHRYRLTEPQQQKKPQTIFVCSMADLFGEWVPDSWIEEVFAACKKAPQHRYLFLTKNPERYSRLAQAGKLPTRKECPDFWYGTTATKAGDLAFAPGGIRYNTFISIEPLLGPLGAGLGSFGGARLIIVGAETGNRKDKVTPRKEWVDNICKAADLTHAAVFMKDSICPVMGKENMRRDLPWKKRKK